MALLEAAVRAPSTRAREPWVFLVLQDRVTLRKISERAKELWRHESPRREAYELLGVPPTSRVVNEFWDPTFSLFHGAGTLVVVATRSEDEFADGECWLAAANLMLAAPALGLGTCVVGAAVAALRSPEIRREIGLPAAVRPVVPLAVGIPKDAGAPGARRPPEILIWRR